MVVNFTMEFEPSIDEVIAKTTKYDASIANNIDTAVKETSLILNREAKEANPKDIGHSRRAWKAPVRLAQMVWLIRNDVEYTEYIKYGVKKKSDYVSEPEGVTISGGKPFMKVIEEMMEMQKEKFEEKVKKIFKDAWS